MKIGRLVKLTGWERKYPVGTYFTFNRIKSYDDDGTWDGDFRIIAEFKCEKGFTESGFHRFEILESDFQEIKEEELLSVLAMREGK